MKIENNNQPAFKASLVNKVKIGKLINGKYANEFVSFVKINPMNQGDIDALKYCTNYWENDKFGLNIYYAACALKNSSKYYKDHEVYTLTSQASDFEKLDSDKILGFVHTAPYIDSPLLIEHIQVNPKYLQIDTFSQNNKEPEYKGIGTAILNSLKLLSNKISCFSASEKSVKDFYTKNGFTQQPFISKYYIWQKK